MNLPPEVDVKDGQYVEKKSLQNQIRDLENSVNTLNQEVTALRAQLTEVRDKLNRLWKVVV